MAVEPTASVRGPYTAHSVSDVLDDVEGIIGGIDVIIASPVGTKAERASRSGQLGVVDCKPHAPRTTLALFAL